MKTKYAKHTAFLLIICFLLLAIPSIHAQSTCPALVETAVTMTGDACGDMNINEACYGHDLLAAESWESLTDWSFDTPGDRVGLETIRSLQARDMNEDDEIWGIGLMRLRANLPGTVPGQGIIFVVMGHVQLTPTIQAVSTSAQIIGNQAINIRQDASTDSPIIATLSGGTSVTVHGQNTDGSWIRIALDDGNYGWVFADLIRIDDESVDLPDVAQMGTMLAPLQAFYFSSSIGDSNCLEAPESGIIIHTPKDAITIEFMINEVHIEVGSTIFLQAEADGDFIIRVLEGQITATAFDVTQTAVEGSQLRIPLDENAIASGPPSSPEPMDTTVTDSMDSVLSLLPDEIEVAVAVTEADLAEIEAEQNICRVVATGSPNVRKGPGTVYEVLTQLPEGRELEAIGTYIGTDGYTWYKTPLSVWIREDVVTTSGDCESLPIVENIPEPPVVVVSSSTSTSSSNSNGVYYINPLWHVGTCQYWGDEGSPNIIITAGTGGLANEAEAYAWQSVATTTATINGQPAPAFVDGTPYDAAAGSPGDPWAYESQTPVITLEPGEYTIVVSTNDPRSPQTRVCNYVVSG